jgi:hypothetical protein
MAAEGPTPIVVDARGLPPDLSTIARLARLQLRACRLGWRLQLAEVSDELRDLLAFAGLDAALGVEPRREAEEREERLRVEEERELGDPPA